MQATHRLFATATPLDRPFSAAYFMASIIGQPVERIEQLLGFKITRGIDPIADTLLFVVLRVTEP